jgi:hypothetical protein
MKNDNPKYLVVGPPRGGFTLLISVINELYRLKNIQKDDIQNTVNHFVPLAGEFVSKTINNFFKKHINLDDLFYSGEFRKVLVGGPKWLDKNDTNTMCVRKYLGVKGMGDFTFIQYHPRFLLDYDEVVHSHNHPRLWIEQSDFKDYMKFTCIRNPIDIIHSSVYSINALASEYIQRCVAEDETTIRYKLALNKFTQPDFMEGLVIYLVNYLKEFIAVKDSFLYAMKWENLILEPVKTILEIAGAAEMNIGEKTTKEIWENIQYRNLTRWHRHSFRKGVIGDWKSSITNTHLELFKSYGFNEFLEELGYEKIEYFVEADYTPVQKTIEEYFKKGKVYKPHEDEDMYTFAFNKTNLTSSKFPFKSYSRLGDIHIERSTFKDESIIQGFREVIGRAVGIANQFLTEIRDVKLNDSNNEDISLKAVKARYYDIYRESLSGDMAIYDRVFDTVSGTEKENEIPRLVASYESYNVVSLNNKCYGVPQSLGPMDLQRINFNLYPSIIHGDSVDIVRDMIYRRMTLDLQFYNPEGDALFGSIEKFIKSGCKKFFLMNRDEKSICLKKRFHDIGQPVFYAREDFSDPESCNADVIVITETNTDLVSESLLSLLNLRKGIVLAPITDRHYSNQSIFISCIPKSGTHMLIKMLEIMGIRQNLSSLPCKGKWNVVQEYSYHTPCKRFIEEQFLNAFLPMGKHPLFYSPVIFMYRNPLDILVSEVSWFQRQSEVFSNHLNSFEDLDSKLLMLIDSRFVLGNIRERMLKYIGWLDFTNVIPVSYEELVGSGGGGSDEHRIRSVWSIQLKLHIPGCPHEIAPNIYDTNSPTFSKGKIGRHKELLKEVHYKKFLGLPQDFMEKMGYNIDTLYSRHIEGFRRRPLKMGYYSSEAELWQQRLIKESFYGFNIVYAGGQYVVLDISIGNIDLSIESNRHKDGVYLGFGSYEDALTFLILEECRKHKETTLK